MLALDKETKWKEELKYQLEAKTAKETSTSTSHPHPRLLIVFLDVDDTLVMSNQYQGKHDGGYHYHQPLIAALKRAGLTEVYLFTAYLLRGISKTRQEEAIGSASRLKLIQYLTSQGLHVKGTLTLLDPVYDQGIGAYYQEVIRPFEERVLKGESLLEGEAQKLYQEAYDRELGYLKTEQALDKAKLFAYTKAQLQSLHPQLTQ